MARLLDRYLPPAYRAILRDEFTWRDNPVLQREQRRENRRRDRSLLLLTMLGTLLAAFTAAAWALPYFRNRGLYHESVPPVLGGSYPVAFFALFSSIHIWFVWQAAYRRSYYFLLQEYRQNSLATLLCTRITPFQLLLMASVQPFRQGMLAAAAGLPFYAWVLSLGGVSLIELLGLYLLFAMISFRPPRWSLPVFAGIPAEEILKRQRAGRPKTWGEWWIWNSFWIAGIGSGYLQWAFGSAWLYKLLWPLTTLIPRSASRILPAFIVSWVLAVVRFLWAPLPYYGFRLPPIAIVVPMYLFARLMAIWESSIYLRTGDADTSQSLWDLREYWRLRRVYGVLLPFLLLGFLWEPYVASGLTSVLLVVNGGQKDVAIGGLFYLVGGLAALVCWARAREMSAIRRAFGGKLMSERGGAMVELGRLWEAWYVLAPIPAVYGGYIIACLLSGAWPFPASAVRIVAPLLVTAVAGAAYARGIRPGLWSYAFALILPLAGWFIPVGGIGGAVAGISPLAALMSLTEHTSRILAEIPLAHAEPAPWYVCVGVTFVVGVLANVRVARRTGGTADVSWSRGSVYSPLPTAIPSMIAPDLAAARTRISQPAAPQPVLVTAAPPVLFGAGAPPVVATGAESTPLKPKPFLRKSDTPAALRLIAWLQSRWDNALATKELRVLLRGHLGKDEQIIYSVLLVLVTFLVVYRADISSTVLEGPARLLFGPAVVGGAPWFTARGGAAVVFGGLAAALLLLMTLVAGAAALSVCGTSFGRERDKSTLGFVLVTPLPTRAILFGKLVGMLGPTAIAVAVIFGWSAVLCMPVAAEIGVQATLSGLLFGLLLCALVVALGAALGLAWSTVLRRETDSVALAFLFLFASVFAVSYATAVWPDILGGENAPRQWIWLAFLALSDLILVPILLTFTRWRLDRARQGDVAFESAVK